MSAATVLAHESKRLPVRSLPPTVFVLDDDISVREALQLMIEQAGWAVAACASAEEFLAHERPPAPSCLVLDVTLPDSNGLELQERLVREGRGMPVIFITGFANVPMAVRAMKAGAVEFLTKPLGGDDLLSAIGQALERSSRALAGETEIRVLRGRYASLSKREREVMGWVVRGRLNKVIGAELGISEITVKAHRGRLMRKMQADSLAALVGMAGKLGLPQTERGRNA